MERSLKFWPYAKAQARRWRIPESDLSAWKDRNADLLTGTDRDAVARSLANLSFECDQRRPESWQIEAYTGYCAKHGLRVSEQFESVSTVGQLREMYKAAKAQARLQFIRNNPAPAGSGQAEFHKRFGVR